MRRFPPWLAALCLGVACVGCGEDTGLVRRLAGIEVPLAVDFGQVPLGATKRLAVTVTNSGNLPLEIQQAEATEPFAVTTPAEPVPPGGTFPVVVAFRADQIDPVEGTLRLVSNASELPEVTVSLRGAGEPSFLEVSPIDVDFTGTERFDRQAVEIVLRQRGPAPIEGDIVTEGFRRPNHFSMSLLESFGQRGRFAVAGQSELVLELAYSPIVEGDDGGIIRFETCGDRCGLEVRVTAGSVAAFLEFDPPTVQFGEVGIGETASRQVVLRNAGTEGLDLEEVRLEAPSTFTLELDQGVPARLDAGAAVQALLTFSPVDAVEQNGTIQVRSSLDRFSERSIPIDGQGVGPRFQVSPERIGFGVETTSSRSTRQFLMANAGSSQVQVNDVTLGGHPAFELDELPGLPVRLGPGETVLAAVAFRAQALGTYTATITVQTDDPARPSVQVPVRAVRAERFCDLRLQPSELNFGLLAPGFARTESATLLNEGTQACEILQADFRPPADPFFRWVSAPPTRVEAGSSVAIEVEFSPTARRSAKSTLAFRTNDPVAPIQQLPVVGTSEEYGEIRAIPRIVDFGVGRPNCSRIEREVLLLNSGAVTVEVSEIRLEGTGGPDIAFASEPSFFVPAGVARRIPVSFTPTGIGDQSVDLVIEFSDLPFPIRVPMQGRAESDAVVTERFEQQASPEADVLFVIDDSCSMFDDQQALAANIESFIDGVDLDEFDFRIGVTTISVNEDDGRLVGPVIDSTINSRSAVIREFERQAAVGVTGSGWEQGFEAALRAMERAERDQGANRDLLRPDASFTLILVTDEDDQSPGSPLVYAKQMEELVPNGLTTAVVGGGPSGCATAFPSPRYEEFVQITGGQSYLLCDDWGQNLRLLGELTFGLRSVFGLEASPDGNRPIVVRVNGMTRDPSSYSVSVDPPQVSFETPPDRGAEVEVAYTPACDP